MDVDNAKNAVVFGFTSNHVGAVASVVRDLSRVSKGILIEFVFFHDAQLKPSDIKLLSALGRSRFVEYRASDFMCLAPSTKVIRRFTPMVFTKFECLRLLSEYDAVVWLDYDIVVRKDISELFEPCFGGLKILPGGSPVRSQFFVDVDGFDMAREGMCGSTIAFDRNLQQPERILQFCYEATQKYLGILNLGEQGIFDIAIQKFSLNPMFLDPHLYTPHPSKYATDAKILHAFGGPKFWNGLHNEQWQQNYAQWIESGGSPIVDKSSRRHLLARLMYGSG